MDYKWQNRWNLHGLLATATLGLGFRVHHSGIFGIGSSLLEIRITKKTKRKTTNLDVDKVFEEFCLAKEV